MITGFITVRSTSRRLPRKCFLPFGEWTIIEHIIRRTKHYGIDPILCTSTDSDDDELEEIAHQENIKVFRGSLVNKLKRWYDCCEYFQVDRFHSIDADDPFFDGELIHQSMDLLDKGYDVVCPTESSSNGNASVGYSLTKNIIKRALEPIKDNTDTEMMWYFLDKVKNIKKIILSETKKKPLKVRLTLDYEEDFWLLESVRKIVGNLADRSSVDQVFIKNPDMYKINWFRNKEWELGQKEKSL
tara:strand:- start:1353 stop:2081 length:729 start_codon:yes stop_codon:yes gene_type:complete